jgi:ATP-dependent helicase/nuclease subunit A
MSENIHFISAGAGSGKTYALTQKLEELLSTSAVSPAGVIATTFTRLAAGELKERVRGKLIEVGQLSIANQMEQSLIGTVNGVCGEILRRFAFEAGLPPDQRVVEETQGDILFYQAMETALENNSSLIRKMNATSHRLQITDSKNQLNWRSEIKDIADAARANNQSAAEIRGLGVASSTPFLKYFPAPVSHDLDAGLLGAVNHAISGIDTDEDTTKTTREYVSYITGVRAGLIKRRLTWHEWISLSKKMPGVKSKRFAEPIADIAINYDTNPQLHNDIRYFAEQAFIIAADSLDAYQRVKTQKGLIDFVDQEQRLYQLLDNASVKATLAEELQLLMVDEFQDTSPIQLALFLKLSRLAEQVIWVGDIKQSIYGFRGADPALMTAVVDQVITEGKKPEILGKSWRSRPELVHYTNNLFVPAFADTLKPDQVELEPAREAVSDEPAVELWRLTGKNKALRASALTSGVRTLVESGETVVDKDTNESRSIKYGDIAILCRTHSSLSDVAKALAEAKVPVRRKQPGLLSTPEGCLAMACLRRLVDPSDTLATAEIHSLTTCDDPAIWIGARIEYLSSPDARSTSWLEEGTDGPIPALKAARSRLPLLTPTETLRVAISSGGVRETVYRWGPSAHRGQHRLNNLSALLDHSEDYVGQCTSRNEPATSAGLVLWLQALKDAGRDTQASGDDENAIQLVTHHGAKGLEWPIVISMDMDAKLRPRILGLNVLPSSKPMKLSDPLAGRTLRYWPKFIGAHSTGIHVLEKIEESDVGEAAMEHAIAESKRLMYVSLTRPRDRLIITMDNKKTSGPWMDTLGADWMLPDGENLELPDGTVIPTRIHDLEVDEIEPSLPEFEPRWYENPPLTADKLPLRLSPSSIPALDSAKIGEVIDLGERLEVEGDYDPAVLGSAIHAVIATSMMGQDSTARVLDNHGVLDIISVEAANECTARLLKVISSRFKPISCFPEFPIQYSTETGQLISGWIDLLLETENGYVLIDHKASPRSQSEWEEIALSYSGQLDTYASGVSQITGKPVISRWVHFAVTGGLVEVN